MLIDLIRLKNNIDEYINIDFMYSFPKEYLDQTELLELNDIHVKGKIFKNSLDDIQITLNIEGIMALPCALTLKPVNYKFSSNIDESLEELSNITENLKKDENTLDILPIIWENILMEIPMKVVSEDADLSDLKGDGWEFVTGERKKTNPELEKLKDLL
ncbi:MAG: DUF177 domain-containing protein [Clostridium sp.]|nr:DUF177 domain-containing protein [Clostridium sp.]MCM1444378.1 DUF177 domain-containing protein [Candidatus Amulumruptor caecigallinarius]